MNIKERLAIWCRILTFRDKHQDWAALDEKFLAWGLTLTWIAGMGRYWDDSKANFLQKLGVGSVLYVFVLAFLFWIILKALRPEHFSYRHILTFVTLTAPTSLPYAIPVELWFSLETSNQINLWFLAVVALWRFSLYFRYLLSFGELGLFRTVICALTPLAFILMALTMLNLHHVVVDVMGGIREADRSSQDAAYMVMMVFSFLALPVSAISGILWLGTCFSDWMDRRKSS